MAGVLAAGAFGFLIAFGGVLGLPGRGSERAMGANVLGPALLLLAAAYAGQASGYRALLRDPSASRSAAAGSVTAAFALAIAGAIFLIDRIPCTEGLYCSGQVLGPTGNVLFYFWALIPFTASILIGTLALAARPADRDLYPAGFALLVADGVLFGFMLVPVVAYVGFAAFGLGAVTNGILVGAFLEELRHAPLPSPTRAGASMQRPNV